MRNQGEERKDPGAEAEGTDGEIIIRDQGPGTRKEVAEIVENTRVAVTQDIAKEGGGTAALIRVLIHLRAGVGVEAKI